ncbi:hypothetical protein KA005_09755 [bacterium]|nr:hypothetical protein [bacterium]
MALISNSICMSIEHGMNPLHIYCRMRDLGVREKRARKAGKFYEERIFPTENHLLRKLSGYSESYTVLPDHF